MKPQAIALMLTILFSAHIYGQTKRNDVIVMKNGDRITCEIKSLEHGILYVKLDYVDGTISVDWSKVAKVDSPRLFIVKTEAGLILQGVISTVAVQPDQPAQIEVAESPVYRVALETPDVVTIDTSSRRFWRRLNGNINLGMNYSKGNNSKQYNLSSSVEYPRERWNMAASVDSNLTASDGVPASTRNDLRFGYSHLMRRTDFFYSVGGGFLQSTEQGISRQTNFAGGIGYYLTNSNHSKISILGGLVWQRTNYNGLSNVAATQSVAAARVSSQVRIFKFKKTNFDLDATLLPSITDPGRVYFKINEGYYLKIFSNLTWNMSFYGSWDTRPPNGLPGSDYGMSTGLGWTFGNK